jgi:hypothetical protein
MRPFGATSLAALVSVETASTALPGNSLVLQETADD